MGVLKVFVYFVSYQNSTEVKKKKGGLLKKKVKNINPQGQRKLKKHGSSNKEEWMKLVWEALKFPRSPSEFHPTTNLPYPWVSEEGEQ